MLVKTNKYLGLAELKSKSQLLVRLNHSCRVLCWDWWHSLVGNYILTCCWVVIYSVGALWKDGLS
jgi:hypothetical protein